MKSQPFALIAFVVASAFVLGIGYLSRRLPRHWRRRPHFYRMPILLRGLFWVMAGAGLLILAVGLIPGSNDDVIAMPIAGAAVALGGAILAWGYSTFFLDVGETSFRTRGLFSTKTREVAYDQIGRIERSSPTQTAVNLQVWTKDGTRVASIPERFISTEELLARVQVAGADSQATLAERHVRAIESGHSDNDLRRKLIDDLNTASAANPGEPLFVGPGQFFMGNVDDASIARHLDPHPGVLAFHEAVIALAERPGLVSISMMVNAWPAVAGGPDDTGAWPYCPSIIVTLPESIEPDEARLLLGEDCAPWQVKAFTSTEGQFIVQMMWMSEDATVLA